MRKRPSKNTRKRTPRSSHEEQMPAAVETAGKSAGDRLGSFYNAGPALYLDEASKQKRIDLPAAGPAEAEPQAAALAHKPGPAPTASGGGQPQEVTVFGGRTSLRLHGRTDAQYDGGSYHTEDVRARPASGCESCSRGTCFHVTGRLVATYHVTTTVTLPGVNDFPDLTPCQRERVQRAIDDVLAPHEQQHVRAFEQYNGTTRHRFDLTICRSEFDAAIQSMFEAEERQRRSVAQAASDALDPFHFTVDLDCEEQTSAVQPAPGAGQADAEV